MNDQNLNQFDGGLGGGDKQYHIGARREEISPPAIRETEEDLPRIPRNRILFCL